MARPIVPLAQAVPIKSLARDRYLYDAGRLMGLLVLATRGTGKSTLLGRIVALQDFLRGVPLVILDPLGGTIDYFGSSL